jgi:hypothetical protein
MKYFLGVAVTLLVGMPGIALAQSPDRPVVELGAQGSKRIRDEGQSLSLRVTVPLTRRTAIEATADIQKSFELKWEGGTRRSAREFSVHWRQTVFTSGRWQIFGVLGAGRDRVEHNYPERINGAGRVEPASTNVQSEFMAHFGPAVQVQLAPWLALRGDLRGTVGDHRGVRGMVGAVVPIRRARAGDLPTVSGPPPRAAAQPAATTPPPAAWRRVKPGDEVWVWLTTITKSLVHGDVVAISDSSLTIREQDREVTVRLDEVRSVEGRDGVANGFLLGMVPGAVAGGLVGNTVASGICSGSTTCDSSVNGYSVALGAVGGAVVGGLFGMMVDALIPGRQTLFRGNTVVVTPVVTPTKKAVNVAIRLR